MGAIVATPSILSLLQSCQGTEEVWIPTFYSEEEGKFVKSLIEVMLPSSGDLPGASELNLHVFIDKYQKEVLSVDDKGPHRKTLRLALDDLLESSGKEDVFSASDSDYESLLTKYLSGSYGEQQAMVDEIDDHLDANNDDPSGLSKPLQTYMFLNDLRSLSVWAYQNNEYVGENILAYKPIPAEQQGCVDLQATTGGKAWALAW